MAYILDEYMFKFRNVLASYVADLVHKIPLLTEYYNQITKLNT